MIHVYASGGESQDKLEFSSSTTNASNDGTNPKTGSRCFLLDYNLVNADVACELVWSSMPTYRNWSVQFHLRVEGTPSADITLCADASGDQDKIPNTYNPDVHLRLTTARKLKIGGTTGSTVLTIGQYYQIELRVDKTNGTVYLRIDETDEFNKAVSNNTKTSFSFGETSKLSPTDPVVTARIDDMVLLTLTENELPPWLNTQSCNYRAVDANGNYADFLGSDANKVNNYLQVDEHTPHDTDTTYNGSEGTYDTLERDSYNVTNKTINDTIVGITIYAIVRDTYNDEDLEYDAPTSKIHIRDGGTDEDNDFTGGKDEEFHGQRFGYGKRLDGSALTEASIDALEIGVTTKPEPHTASAAYYPLDGTSQPRNATLLPNADSAVEDGDWVISVAGNDAFSVIDNDIGDDFAVDQDTDGDIDYMSTATTGHLQGFKVPTDTVGDRIITGITIRIRTSNFSPGTAGDVRFYYKDSGGTKHFSSVIAVNGAMGVEYTWSTNPSTGNGWAKSEITDGEFGIEANVVNSGKEIQILAYNVRSNYRSELRITSAFLVTAHGDALTEFTADVTFVPKVMIY